MRATRIKIAKHFCYCLLAVLLFVLQVTPGLFAVAGVRPMLLVGYAVALAFFEGEFAGGLYGILCGLLCDLYGYDIQGFYAIMLFVLCVVIGVAVKSYMRPGAANAALFTFAAELLIQLTSILFQLGLWGYSTAEAFFTHSLPLSLYTALAALPLFYLVRALSRFFGRKIEV